MVKLRLHLAHYVFVVLLACSLSSLCQGQAIALWLGEKIASKLFDKGWNLLTGEPDPAEIAKDLKDLEAELRGKDSIYAYEIAQLRQDQTRFVKKEDVKQLVDLALKDMESRMSSLEQRQAKVSDLLARIEKPLGVIANLPPVPPKISPGTGAGAPGSSLLMREYGPLLVQSHNALEATKTLLAQGYPETSSKVRASLEAETAAAAQADALLAKAKGELQTKAAELANLQKEFPASDPRLKEAQAELSHLRWLTSMLSPGYRDARGTLLLPLEFLRPECSDLLASLVNSGVKPETLLPILRDLLVHPLPATLAAKPELPLFSTPPVDETLATLAPYRQSANTLLLSGSAKSTEARRFLNELTRTLKTATEEAPEVVTLRQQEKDLLAELKTLHEQIQRVLDGALLNWMTVLKTKRQNAPALVEFRETVLQPLYRLLLSTRPWLDGGTGDVQGFLAMLPAQDARSITQLKAQSIILPKVDLRGATIAEALEFLRTKTRELDPGHDGLNFVLLDPPASSTITVSLVDIPVIECLRYFTNLCNLRLVMEDSALVVCPLQTGKIAAAGNLPPTPSKGKGMAARAADIIIPTVTFRGATLWEAVEFLTIKSQSLDPEGQGVKVTLAATGRDLSNIRLDVDLKSIPLSAAARYCAMLSGLELRVSDTGLIIQPSSR